MLLTFLLTLTLVLTLTLIIALILILILVLKLALILVQILALTLYLILDKASFRVNFPYDCPKTVLGHTGLSGYMGTYSIPRFQFILCLFRLLWCY